jgi:ribonuclease HI
MTQVDPDIEAELLGKGRQIPGDTFKRTVTWVWPNGLTTLINNLNVPVRATPQDLLIRVCTVLKIPELDQPFTIITPEDWRYARAIRAEFAYERPDLTSMRVVSEKIFKEDFNPMLPVFIETDGACAGNQEKHCPGGWGALIAQGSRVLKRWGAKADTSNNEMEYWAMLEALQFVPKDTLVIMETDSQGCIDGITKYRLRWEKRHWRKDDGSPVENADLIQCVCQRVDQLHVGFWKVKGHNHDQWNDAADALAVQGRNEQATQVNVQLIFRPVIGGKEGFEGISRVSMCSHANIHDFWPILLDKFGSEIGEPEDYEIWEGHSKLAKPLVSGRTYEIASRFSPGRPKVHPQLRRNSIDCGPKATMDDAAALRPIRDDGCLQPPPLVLTASDREIPPQWRVQVVYQAHDAPEREWRGFFTEDDTEDSIEKRARGVFSILGCWRRLAYWRDANGIRIAMTNRKKEVIMRYHTELDSTIKELPISEDDTPATALIKLKVGQNFHLVDNHRVLFSPARTHSWFSPAFTEGERAHEEERRAHQAGDPVRR